LSRAEPDRRVIAYLAPEIPALSATFVYEELLGLENLGFTVIPISVRPPKVPAGGYAELTARTFYLYHGSPFGAAWIGLTNLLNFRSRIPAALRYVGSDILAGGLFRLQTWKLALHFLAGARLAKILRDRRCSHLHIHFAHFPTQIGMYASALTGIPFTVTAHANDIFERPFLIRTKSERAKKFFTVSNHNCAYLRKLGVADSKLTVVRCGVDLSHPPILKARRTDCVYTVGCLGRFVEKKGMDMLLRAVAHLRSRRWSIELQLAGDGPLRDQLEALAQGLEIKPFVQFVGSLSHEDVPEWLSRLDCFVLASKRDRNGDMDGIPVVLMEAMAQLIPVVSTRISGIPELVVHEETGLLAEPGNWNDLAEQMARILTSGDLRARTTQAGYVHVQREFDRVLNLRRLVDHFSFQ
jgi:colanic acid/amylovoran biosynthesis glycosyltransferase